MAKRNTNRKIGHKREDAKGPEIKLGNQRRTRNSCPSDFEMLTSDIFDHYLETILKTFPEERSNLFMCLDSLWFNVYACHSKEKALHWISKANVFCKNYVIVPIVMWNHWNLLILCGFDEVDESTNKCAILLDSLQGGNKNNLLPLITKFIGDIHGSVGISNDDTKARSIPILVPKVPEQSGAVECGMYALYFAYLFMKDCLERFKLEGMPYFMTPDWFTLHMFNEWRSNLSSGEINQIVDDVSHGNGARSRDEIVECGNTKGDEASSHPPKPIETANVASGQAGVIPSKNLATGVMTRGKRKQTICRGKIDPEEGRTVAVQDASNNEGVASNRTRENVVQQFVYTATDVPNSVQLGPSHTYEPNRFFFAADGTPLAYDEKGKDINVTREVTRAWRSKYDDFYPHWSKVPLSTRDIWFAIFQARFTWDPSVDATVRNCFEMVGSTSLKNNLHKAKADGKKPSFMNDNVYDKAKEFWASVAFKCRSAVNKSNRLNDRESLGPSTHCGGSRSTTKSSIHLEQELKRKPNRSEIYFLGKYSEKKQVC